VESNSFKKALRRTTLALSMLAFAALTVQGCSILGGSRDGDQRVIVRIHPIDKKDIVSVPAGSIITFPKGDTFLVEEPSFNFTTFYVNEVMNAQVGK